MLGVGEPTRSLQVHSGSCRSREHSHVLYVCNTHRKKTNKNQHIAAIQASDWLLIECSTIPISKLGNNTNSIQIQN